MFFEKSMADAIATRKCECRKGRGCELPNASYQAILLTRVNVILYEAFQFRGKMVLQSRSFVVCGSRKAIEWSHPKRISRDKQQIRRQVNQHERKHAVQHGECLLHAVLEIKMDDDFTVGACSRRDLYDVKQLFKIVNFSVANQDTISDEKGLIGCIV